MSTSTTTTTGATNVTISHSSVPSEAMKRCARKMHEKLRSKHKQPKKPSKKVKEIDQRSPKKQNQNHNAGYGNVETVNEVMRFRKGKTYKSKDDRKLKEISAEKHLARNYLRCSKPGGRNSRSAFRMRNFRRLGTGLGPGQAPRRRLDRPWSFEEDDESGYLHKL